jgi:uncharacterized protein with PhoU and TrkA domain
MLQKEGTTILSISRTINGEESRLIPQGDTVIKENDLLTVYGRDEAVKCLFMREAGNHGDKVHQIRIKQHDAIQQLGATEGALT